MGTWLCAALGQVMLYVDGMNGVMAHNNVIQWLYTLIASKVHRRLRPWHWLVMNYQWQDYLIQVQGNNIRRVYMFSFDWSSRQLSSSCWCLWSTRSVTRSSYWMPSTLLTALLVRKLCSYTINYNDYSLLTKSKLRELIGLAVGAGVKPWTNLMNLLNEKDGSDTELLVYSMTLINKVRIKLVSALVCC